MTAEVIASVVQKEFTFHIHMRSIEVDKHGLAFPLSITILNVTSDFLRYFSLHLHILWIICILNEFLKIGIERKM